MKRASCSPKIRFARARLSRQIGFGSFFGEGGATVSGGVFRDDAAEEKEKRKERFTLREPGAQTAKPRLQ